MVMYLGYGYGYVLKNTAICGIVVYVELERSEIA